LIDGEAEDSGEEEDVDDADDESQKDDSEDDEQDVPLVHKSRRKTNMIVDDDEEEEEAAVTSTARNEATTTVSAVTSPVVRNPFLPQVPGSSAPMGLTQAFAATMADTQPLDIDPDQDDDSLAALRDMPAPYFDFGHPNMADTLAEETQNRLDIALEFAQSQIMRDSTVNEEGMALPTDSQMSEIPDPTQDVGFGLMSPIKGRFVSAPPSTVDTVLVNPTEKVAEPVVQKKGRLQRRAAVATGSDDDEENAVNGAAQGEFVISANAFDVLKKGAKKSKKVEEFDKKKSEAKGMVEEQADESEDEYAGLGGASDEDSGEEDEEVEKMMDHGEVEVDERKLAAFYA
jgi:mediator of replication checkpoint protein 1